MLAAALLSAGVAIAAQTVDDAATVSLAATRLDQPPARATFAFTGDLHAVRAVNRGALQPDGTFDYSPMFADVAEWLSRADVAVCHMEQPIAPPGQPVFVEPPVLSSAAALVPALAQAGYDLCSTASNHGMDRGVGGVTATLDALDAVGIGHHGTARTADEASAHIFQTNGISVAFLSSTFALQASRDQPWRTNVTEPNALIADARRAREDGAVVVVLSLEWGIDKQSAPTAQQRALAEQLTRSGAFDLIVGHQAHVLQPIDQANGTWVVWGLGNFLSNHPSSSDWPASSQDGAIVFVEITQSPTGQIDVGRPTAIPTWVDKTNGFTIRTVDDRTDPTLSASTRSALGASLERTRSVMGGFLPPGW